MADVVDARAAVAHGPQTPYAIEGVEVEAPRAGEVRVRLAGVGVCHTDVAFKAADGLALPFPCVLGHEGAGVVEAVGADVHDLAVGDHVVLSFGSCGRCASCQAGRPAYCDEMAVRNFSGGRPDGSSPLSQEGRRVSAGFFTQSSFATYAIAERRNTVKVDRDAPLELLGPLGCGVQTGAGTVMNVLRPGRSDQLAVFGGGAVGLSALLGAHAIDAGPVIVVEPHAGRRALALELGAAHAVDPSAVEDVTAEVIRLSGGGVHVAVDTTGADSVIAAAGGALRAGGVLALVGLPRLDAVVPVSAMAMLSRGLTVRGVCEGDADPQVFIPQLIALHRAGRFPFDRLITRFPFERINDAMDALHRGEAVKAVLTFAA